MLDAVVTVTRGRAEVVDDVTLRRLPVDAVARDEPSTDDRRSAAYRCVKAVGANEDCAVMVCAVEVVGMPSSVANVVWFSMETRATSRQTRCEVAMSRATQLKAARRHRRENQNLGTAADTEKNINNITYSII